MLILLFLTFFFVNDEFGINRL